MDEERRTPIVYRMCGGACRQPRVGVRFGARSWTLPGWSIRSSSVITFERVDCECELTPSGVVSTLTSMEVHFPPEIQRRLDRLASETGCPESELVLEAMPGYLDELEQTRAMLDSRYDDIKSGRVQPIDGEEAFRRLRAKGVEWRKSRA